MDQNFDLLAEDCIEYSQDRYQQLEELMDDFVHNGFSILTMGLRHHGKSSLLRKLMDSNAEQTISSTTKLLHYQIAYDHYLDTPGFEHFGKNTTLSLSLIANTDLHLFVHDITTGLLNEQELAFLKLIFAHMDKESFFKRTIFVLSHKDMVAEPLALQAKLKEQLQQEFGLDCLYQLYTVNALQSEDLVALRGQIAAIKEQLLPKLNAYKLKRVTDICHEVKNEVLANKQRLDKLIDENQKHCALLQHDFERCLTDYRQLEEALFNSNQAQLDEELLKRLNSDVNTCNSSTTNLNYTMEQGEELLCKLKECIVNKYDLDPSFEEQCPKLIELRAQHELFAQNIKIFDEILLKINTLDSQLESYRS